MNHKHWILIGFVLAVFLFGWWVRYTEQRDRYADPRDLTWTIGGHKYNAAKCSCANCVPDIRHVYWINFKWIAGAKDTVHQRREYGDFSTREAAEAEAQTVTLDQLVKRGSDL